MTSLVKTLFTNQWRPLTAFGVVTYTTYLYFINTITPCHTIITTYFIVDTFFAQPEALLHHALSLLALSCKYIYGFTNEEANIVLKPMIKTEISTIFLILKVFYEENASETIQKNPIAKTLYAINDLIFVVTFTKTRIWDLTFDAALNPEIHQNNQLYFQDSTLKYLHFYIGFFGIYAMNLYWFSIICRKIFKVLVINTRLAWMNTQANAQHILPYTMFLAGVPLYSSQNLFYISGIIMLSLASHLYHSKKRNILESGEHVLIINNVKVDGLTNNNTDVSIEFFFDAGATHIKSLLAMIAIGSDRGWSSLMLHFGCFVGSYIYASAQTQIAEHGKHMNVLNASIIVPSLYDLLCIMYAVDDCIFQTKILITTMALATIIRVKPLYELNDVLVHLIIVIQTWILAK